MDSSQVENDSMRATAVDKMINSTTEHHDQVIMEQSNGKNSDEPHLKDELENEFLSEKKKDFDW